ncbi:GPP34 family phosphoprotein [Kitasatospora sp. NPDC089913]|uniref:GOLPH3/VPS74 family protein n=1 Tax=Streptomycetaceae TaxID=2062 RepID=UPI00087930AB|nr:GPP34 family phosphoprotein [Streptomyces sp. TLI_053]SDT82818.1 Golgi phosphoprotein 3 (GPP34) [Streptomyces sp. TLI_053]
MSRALHLSGYLLAFDTRSQSLQDRTRAGFLVRAATLAELAHRGALAEDGSGHVRVLSADPTGDGVLDALLAEAGGTSRSWKAWIRRDREDTLDAVEQRLAMLGVLTVSDRAPHGPVVPRRPVAMDDPREALDLQARVAELVRGGTPAAEAPFADAVLAALAAHGHLRLVLSRHDRKAHADRVTALTDRLASTAPGLARAVSGLNLTMIAAQGGMGGG